MAWKVALILALSLCLNGLSWAQDFDDFEDDDEISDFVVAPPTTTAPVVDSAATDYDLAVNDWLALQAAQSKSCAERANAKQVLVGRKARLSVLILHGLTQYPARMDEYINFFSGYDANILVPRLSHHYNETLKDLDDVHYTDWIKQVEANLKVAKRLGDQVIIVGYSLGGLLASRLALALPNDVHALVLLSPAWRLGADTASTSYWATALTKITGYTANEILRLKAECAGEQPFISPGAGMEIAKLVQNTEDKFGSGRLGDHSTSAFHKIRQPIFLATVENDEAVSSGALDELFMAFDSGYHTRVVFTGKNHSLLTTQGQLGAVLIKKSQSPSRATNLWGQLEFFVRNVLGVSPGSA